MQGLQLAGSWEKAGVWSSPQDRANIMGPSCAVIVAAHPPGGLLNHLTGITGIASAASRPRAPTGLLTTLASATAVAGPGGGRLQTRSAGLQLNGF